MTSSVCTALSFDLGAGSGRAIVGNLNQEDGKLAVHEIHRFANIPVQVGDRLYWDILRLWHEIRQGIASLHRHGYTHVTSIGIDSWAVDFGLIGKSGEMLANPVHYRDSRTDGVMEEVVANLGKDYIFNQTGLQFLPFNTIYQLAAIKRQQPELLAQAETLLMIPDLLRYFMTGEKQSEFTNASTTQLLNAKTRMWDTGLMNRIGLPEHLFLPPVKPGTAIGKLTERLSRELSVPRIPVIAVGEHDTASAVAAVPAAEGNFAYLVSGTWSLMGTEVPFPIINEQVLADNFTNEGGVYGTTRLLKNIMGLWLIQECKRIWDLEGGSPGFSELSQLAQMAKPFRCFIDPDSPRFLHPQHMPQEIRQYCRDTGQEEPETKGEIARCIFESLALKVRYTLERIEYLTGKTFKSLHMVGGGIQNELLCRFTANALGRELLAGPVEASALGNLAVQYISTGKLAALQEARAVIRRSFPPTVYKPDEADQWDAAYGRFSNIASLS